jgi:hypothetical protein
LLSGLFIYFITKIAADKKYFAVDVQCFEKNNLKNLLKSFGEKKAIMHSSYNDKLLIQKYG